MKNQIVNLLSQNIEVLTSEEISQLIEIPPKPEMGDFAFPTQLIMAVLIRVRTRQSVSTTLHLTLLRISTLAI